MSYYNKAYDLANRGKYEEALEILNKICERDADYLVACSLKVQILTAVKQFEEGLKLLKKLKREYPESFIYNSDSINLLSRKAFLLNNYAMHLAKQGYFEKAIKTIKRVFKLDIKNFNDSHDIYGEILTLTGDYEEALTQLGKTVEFPPNYVETYYNLALCSLKAHKFIDALRNINIVLELQNDESKFRKYSNESEFSAKKEEIAREAHKLKRSIDWLLL